MRKLVCLWLMLCLLPVCGLAEGTTTLRIGGFISEYELADFMRDNPDVQVVNSGELYYEASELIQALLTGDATYDVLVINTESFHLPTLLEKGFAVPLNDSPVLLEAYEGMYPFIQKTVSLDGVCYGLPLNLFSGVLSYQPEIFEAIGVAVPSSWQELATLINDFPNQPDEVRENYEIIMWAMAYRSMFFNLMVDAYVTHMQATGEELRFDTPLFRELMALVESMTTENDTEDERDVTPLMQNVDVLQMGYTGRDGRLLALSMDGHTSIGVSAMVAIINPHSQHIPEALRMLEYLAQHSNSAVRLTLMRDGNAPVAYEDYEAVVAAWEQRKAALEGQIAACEEGTAEWREANDALEEHLRRLEDIEHWQHWVLSQEAIDAWQEVAPYIFITEESVLQYHDASGQWPAMTLMQRYLDGSLPMEHFIRQMDEKCQMMMEERR